MGKGFEVLVGAFTIPQLENKPIQENYFLISYDGNGSKEEHISKRHQRGIELAATLCSAGSISD